jgi:DNA primase
MIEKVLEYKALKILEKVDLVELVGKETKLSNSLRGKCPIHHGDNDNLALWPRHAPTVWTCHSHCGSGNAIKFIELLKNFTNEQAIEYLWDELKLEMPEQRPSMVKPAPHTNYSQRLADFCHWAHGNLMNKPLVKAICLDDWGWSEETLIMWQIGYNPKSLKIPGANFGYHEPIYLSQGITIPHKRRGEYLWCNIRRLGSAKPKYMGVAGGRRGLFGVDQWQNHDTLIITEGEKDCISGQKVAGDKYNFAAMGGAWAKPDAWDKLYLAKHRRIVALYDSDESGIEGAMALGFETIRLPKGDLTDYLAQHGRVSTRTMIDSLLDTNSPTVDDLAWLADFEAKTIHHVDKVDKVMAVFAPVQAKQVELFSVPVSGMEYYE